MRISRSGEYGLKGLVFLASQPADRLFLVSEISKREKVPRPFLAKILQRLSKTGLLKSVRGVKGGFTLGKPAHKITMREVLEALDGPIALNRCLIREGECKREEVCPIHPIWEKAQKQLLCLFENTTINDLVIQMNKTGREVKRR